MSKKKNLRRLSVLITAQTMGNLEKLADMEGCGSTGRVIDKLVLDRMLALRPISLEQPEKCSHMKELRKPETADLLRDLFTICDNPRPEIIENKRKKWQEWLRKEACP